MIVTAQAKREQPQDVAKICKQEGIKHFYIELNGANQALLTAPETVTYLRKRIKNLFKRLSAEKEVAVIHCAAGIHRTGTTGYTLLRLHGLSDKEAYEGLKTMRPDTHKGVGDWRI